LDHRLFRTARSAKRNLERSLRANPLVDLDHPFRSGQQSDIAIQQFIYRPIFDDLLLDFHFAFNRFEHFDLSDLRSDRSQGQNGGVGVLVFFFSAKLVHDDELLV
jgi:hypothetical protein